jgi:poly(hydroxyalkanoate) granule-associated protein
MANKLSELAAAEGGGAPLLESVCQSAHKIWQAGLGAFAAAQGQGEALFAGLVERGASLQKQIEESAGHALPGPVSTAAAGSWEKLEKVFEDRVGRTLSKLGVPTQEDLRALGRQIEALNKAIAGLPAASAGASAAAARKRAPAKRARSMAVRGDGAAGQPAAAKKAAPRKKPAAARSA